MMPPLGRSDDSTTNYDAESSIPTGAFGSLLVIGDDFSFVRPLHDGEAILIGRDERAGLRLLDKSVSRRHAMLRVATPTLTLEDLGSANGTFLGDAKLTPKARIEVRAGDVITVGAVTLVVRLRQVPNAHPGMAASRDYLIGRLDAACGRSGRRGAPFALARLCLDPLACDRKVLEASIAAELRGRDSFCEMASGDLVVLFADVSPEEARRAYGRLRERLRDQGMAFQSGLAHHPVDGSTPEALLAVADPRARSPRAEMPIIVADDSMRSLHEIVERIASSPISVLIVGETGTGKEIFAERIHRLSDRADRPLLRLNCAALPEQLLEAELFGYEKGAFTGAVRAKPGLLEMASGGTVFLDEVGELPQPMQAKLLRVLEAGEVLPVGALKPRAVDFRVVAATHRDLGQDIEAGRFRRDLSAQAIRNTAAIAHMLVPGFGV